LQENEIKMKIILGNITAVWYREEIIKPFFEELSDDEVQGGERKEDEAIPRCPQNTLDAL
jgi:hypothetical protein